MENVVNFTGITKLDGDADRSLESAFGKLDKVVILGYDKEGNEYFNSSVADGGDVLWMIERAKKKLLDVPERF